MDRLGALKMFSAVARCGSFAEAARSLHVSPTAASRAVADLEASLGAMLLRRTTRSVSLTPEGASYLERCRHALAELEDAELALRGEMAEPRGRLRVTASEMFGRTHIVPIVRALMARYRELEVDLMLTDRVVKLAEDGVDIAVRNAELPDSALHAVRIAEIHRVLVASPAYLAERGEPRNIAQLHDHDLIMFEGFAPNGEWRFGPTGKTAIHLEPRLTTNNIAAAIECAVAGGGITRATCYQTASHVAAGRLRYLLTDFTPSAIPVSLLFQAGRRGAPNVRAFIDAAKTHFAGVDYQCHTHSGTLEAGADRA